MKSKVFPLVIATLAGIVGAALSAILLQRGPAQLKLSDVEVEPDIALPELELPPLVWPTPRDMYAAGLPLGCDLVYFREPESLEALAAEHHFHLTGQRAGQA